MILILFLIYNGKRSKNKGEEREQKAKKEKERAEGEERERAEGEEEDFGWKIYFRPENREK
jgi:hypothetical protein